jgi:1,4-alpha-glucan branching enzyme
MATAVAAPSSTEELGPSAPIVSGNGSLHADTSSVIRVAAPSAGLVEIRFATLDERDRFDPRTWTRAALAADSLQPGHWEIDLSVLGLADGDYEYELVLDGRADEPVPDPYAEEIVRFGGYRGLFRLRDGKQWHPTFSWEDELTPGTRLPENNELVIYEMPLRWMVPADDVRQVGLGTFDRVIFERLDQLRDLGINAVELLPIQDSADTLNWGYGSRFFFAPDFDMGAPVDLKVLVKRCHQRGIRVIVDVVMNHARECPLQQLAEDWFFLPEDEERRPEERKEEPGRGEGWGGRLFRYRRPTPDGRYPARELHYSMAEFWVREYHIDGFRIDEFRGIDHWEFIQTFRDRAWAESRRLFPDRPFLVIGEDSGRRAIAAQDVASNPGGRRVVDAIWHFAFQEEVRGMMRDGIKTAWGEPSRRDRIRAAIAGSATWDGWGHQFKSGFGDLAQAVSYVTSHDVGKVDQERFMNYAFGELLRRRGVRDVSVAQIQSYTSSIASQTPEIQAAHAEALDQVRSSFALVLTSVGIPMFLAGEEFADVHDLDFTDWRLKMSDPVDWQRQAQPGHRAVWDAVRDLVRLRTSHAALQRNEIEFFYFHPAIDENEGVRVFAYCRTGGQPLGTPGQVVVVANMGPQPFSSFVLPWPWVGSMREFGTPARGGQPQFRAREQRADVPLSSFQARVFTT